ncbi:hypothetical protein OUZ56_003745 [Daphnia magna]|uniref:Uncharacterized protein n=1 Tax=Daphnia magna TaxID=35525 RepID=A0ABR0A9M8_9CRUS|nr:hypothetical protein OUZ56_003745 [Daphnia magna]
MLKVDQKNAEVVYFSNKEILSNIFTEMDRSYQDISIPIIVKTFGLIVFPIVPKSGVETVFLQPAPTQLPMRSIGSKMDSAY